MHYAPDPERAVYREELERLGAEQPNLNLVRAYTRAPGVGEADGHFSLAQLAQAEPGYAERRDLRLRPARTAGRGPRARGPKASSPGCTWRASCRRRCSAPSGVAEGSIHFAGSDLGSRTAAPRSWSRPRGRGSAPSAAAAWASATPALAARPRGTVKNLRTGELSVGDEEEIQICVSAPVGDVVVDL